MARTNWKKAFQDLQEEFRKKADDLDAAYEILTAALDCGSMDVGCIIDMERNHPGTTERAKDFAEECGVPINFGCFVYGAKEMAIEEVESDLDGICEDLEYDSKDQIKDDAVIEKIKAEMEYLKDSLQDMSIDDNYCAWGGVASWGSYGGEFEEENHDLQSLFGDFVVDATLKEAFLVAVKNFFEEHYG